MTNTATTPVLHVIKKRADKAPQYVAGLLLRSYPWHQILAVGCVKKDLFEILIRLVFGLKRFQRVPEIAIILTLALIAFIMVFLDLPGVPKL
jgi:hypothetical protein